MGVTFHNKRGTDGSGLFIKTDNVEEEGSHKGETQIKHDFMVLRMLLVKNLINDFAIFNRNPRLKEIKQRRNTGKNSAYNQNYYNELLNDLKSDFIKNYCNLFSIPYMMLVDYIINNKKEIHMNSLEYLSMGEGSLVASYLRGGVKNGFKPPVYF
jgi:hydroxymethylglutaryl-CoA reductase